MFKRRALLIAAVIGILACSIYAGAASDDTSTYAAVSFPADYRSWQHVKSTLIGAEAKGFAVNGGLHHFYANAKAVEGYRAQHKFPDGAVIVDERIETVTAEGVTKEGARRSLAVMTKDSTRYPDAAGNWGFEVFLGDNQTSGMLTAAPRARCTDCHASQAKRDWVFTDIRP